MRKKHTKNLVRDGDFVYSFSELVGCQSRWAAGQALVGRQYGVIALSDAFDFTAPLPKNPGAAAGAYAPMTTERMAKMIRRSVTLPRTDDECKPLKPGPWRDLNDQVKAIFYHFAIRARGTSYRFDLNLSPEVADQAKSKGKQACEFLRRRVAKVLKDALGFHVEFILALEGNGRERLHVHGTMSLPERLREAARDALKRAGGEWDGEGGQFQVNMRPQQKDPDLRGGTYIVKNVMWAAPKMRKYLEKIGDTRRMPVFEGRSLTVTREIRRDAQELYEAARKLVIDYRKRAGNRS